MMYISQIIVLYTLNLYSTICHLYINKSERDHGWLMLMYGRNQHNIVEQLFFN